MFLRGRTMLHARASIIVLALQIGVDGIRLRLRENSRLQQLVDGVAGSGVLGFLIEGLLLLFRHIARSALSYRLVMSACFCEA